MKTFLENAELIEALTQRYAVKQFEKRDIDTTQLEEVVTSILQLTPTSFGLQAYNFINVVDPDTRASLREHSWGQGQVTDADMFIVLTVPTNFSIAHIEKHMDNLQAMRGIDDEKKAGITGFMNGAIIEKGADIGIQNHEEWLTRQAYIALGNLMTSLAIIGIDSCPLEGINPSEYNRILGLDEKNLTAKVAIAIEKRHPDDKYQSEKKVRFSKEDLFITI